MGFVFLVGLALLFFKGIDGVCFGGTYTATTSLKTLSHTFYSDNEDCTFYIRPNYNPGFYLEISWSMFDLEGSIPACFDYVEVFLTSSYDSIGKYCSDNLNGIKPFNMYSHDGYAMIKFHSDGGTTNMGFSLTYQLKSKTSSYLGTKTLGCSYTGSNAGVFYSNGWPDSYLGSSSNDNCWLRHTLSSSTLSSMRVVVMDLDLYQKYPSYCSASDDYLQIRGSNSYYSDDYSIRTSTYIISGKLCGTSRPSYYTSNYRNIFVYLKRRIGSTSKRGFIVGYLVYGTSGKGSTTRRRTADVRRRVYDVRRRTYVYRRRSRRYSASVGTIVGGSIGGIVFLVAFVVSVVIGCCKASRRNVHTAAVGTNVVNTGVGMNAYPPQQAAIVTSSAGTTNFGYATSAAPMAYSKESFLPPPPYTTATQPQVQPPPYATATQPQVPYSQATTT